MFYTVNSALAIRIPHQFLEIPTMEMHNPKFIPQKRVVTKSLVHWNYFLSLESDFVNFSRYLEFSSNNFTAHSIEAGRLLMAATQECDVLLKQICTTDVGTEMGYRQNISGQFPQFASHQVVIPRFNLSFQPFDSWKLTPAETPKWWTANNKFKHQRHDFFEHASLENALNAISALLLCNIYLYHKEQRLKEIQPNPQLLIAEGLMRSMEPTEVGFAPNFEI